MTDKDKKDPFTKQSGLKLDIVDKEKDKDKDPEKKDDKERKKVSSDIIVLIAKKMVFFQDIIQKTILHVQNNKLLDILGVSEVNMCITTLVDLGKKIKDISEVPITVSNTDNIINVLQTINNELSSLFKIFGTESFEDLLWICFGNNSVKTYAISDMDMNKFELLKKYFHPTSYKLLGSKRDEHSSSNKEKESLNNKEKDKDKDQNNKDSLDTFLKPKEKDDYSLTEKSKNLDIAELSIKVKSFYLKVHGIQIIVHNPQHKKSLIISGIVDDVLIDLIDNKFILAKMRVLKENLPSSKEFQCTTFSRFLASLGIKDLLMYEPHEIYAKYAGYLSCLNTIRQKPIAQVVKEFISSDLFVKRMTIIQLLIQLDKNDNQYLAYLLYDLMSNDANGAIDTLDQTILFDSFPWSIKQFFKDAMNQTIKYTNELTNFDSQKIPLEQQICLLKAPDSVKEKAMQKLKEVKSKSEDSGSKARQYLDGLLKIPFNIYKREPILNLMNEIKVEYQNLMSLTTTTQSNTSYTILDILNTLKEPSTQMVTMDTINAHIDGTNKGDLSAYVIKINDIIKEHGLAYGKLKTSNKPKAAIVALIQDFVKVHFETHLPIIKNLFLSSSSFQEVKNQDNFKDGKEKPESNENFQIQKKAIETKYLKVSNYMNNVKNVLDEEVYGHEKAKKQVERIIGQWVSGNDNTGYVLGFEGAPGIGKTTLAKGLANCLKDEEGNSRPFSLIAIGGDANSSSLVGHSYTYVGSTWGQIVQILMDKKCMNPIILIDEVDKISKTEHGKEIIGILTHLLDTSQNEGFQDKYFSGIELDLSKVLFILSYNDVESIDKILLDRVHRIKFDSLSIEDKIVICNKHLLPNMYKKIGLENMVEFKEETLKYIIEEYTLEPGVRKLKEKLFEIIGELNLDILKRVFSEPNTNTNTTTNAIQITIEDVKTKYFKDKREIKIQKIHPSNQVGVINCLYATSSGNSGILSASAKFFPSEKFLELKLTGLLDQMMQESFQISLTLAYNLLSDLRKNELNKIYNGQEKYGIHLHMGDGSISKSGTSAGIAITLLMYSLLNDIKIKNTFAVTGEASDLNGSVGEIGALSYKFQGGIKAGVDHFIFPKDNSKDYDDFMKKYGSTKLVDGIHFHAISHINEAIELIME